MPVQIVQQYFATIMNISNIGPVCSGWHVRRAVSLLHSVQHRPIGLGTPVRLKGLWYVRGEATDTETIVHVKF